MELQSRFSGFKFRKPFRYISMSMQYVSKKIVARTGATSGTYNITLGSRPLHEDAVLFYSPCYERAELRVI